MVCYARKRSRRGQFLGEALMAYILVQGLTVTAPTTISAFVPPSASSRTAGVPTTTQRVQHSAVPLFGVRSAIRQGFYRILRKSPETEATAPPEWRHPEWNMSGVAVLSPELEEQETMPEIIEDQHHDRHHRQVLAAAFHRHSPSMFHQQNSHQDIAIHNQPSPSHHPSEFPTYDEEKDAPSTALPISSDELNTDNPSSVQRRRLDFQSDKPLYVLPPRSGSLSRLATEFRNMLTHFSNYSMRDLYALPDTRARTIVHGVAASGDDEAVYRAFEILFEDLMPLRIAGRMVFQRLKTKMEKSIREREEQIAHVVEATGLDPRDIEEARIVFFEVTCKLNHAVYLTSEQLTATRMFQSIHSRLNLNSPSELVSKLDRQGNGKIGLEDFLIGLHQCAEDQCEVEGNECYALQVVHELLEEIDSMENPMEMQANSAKSMTREAKELKYIRRYNEMLEIFRSWKDQVPWLWEKKNPGKKWEVVQGCFIGAENEKVVDALRIVYVDYAPLRVAAEFILSLSASLLKMKPEVQR